MYIYLVQWTNCDPNSRSMPVSIRFNDNFDLIKNRFISDVIKYCDGNEDDNDNHKCKWCEEYIKKIPKDGKNFKTNCVNLIFKKIKDTEIFKQDLHFF